MECNKLRRIVPLLCMLTCLLSGCTTTEGKVLAINTVDDEVIVFDEHGNFYTVEDNIATPIKQHYNKECALSLLDLEDKFNLLYVLPGKYEASFKDASAYLTRLKSDGYIFETLYNKPNACEYVSEDKDLHIRLIYTSDGYLRIYCQNSDNVYVQPPYTIEETLDIQSGV